VFPSKQFLPIYVTKNSAVGNIMQHLNHEFSNKNIYSTGKGFEECVREETAHLATLKSKSI
jgi:hypothetical protein